MEILRKARSELSQEDFVKSVGVPWSTYKRWIASDIPPKLTSAQIVKICEICRISPNDLVSFLEGQLDIMEIVN